MNVGTNYLNGNLGWMTCCRYKFIRISNAFCVQPGNTVREVLWVPVLKILSMVPVEQRP